MCFVCLFLNVFNPLNIEIADLIQTTFSWSGKLVSINLEKLKINLEVKTNQQHYKDKKNHPTLHKDHQPCNNFLDSLLFQE